MFECFIMLNKAIETVANKSWETKYKRYKYMMRLDYMCIINHDTL